MYLYADFNDSGYFNLKVPDKYMGKVINVIEKSTNIDVLSESANTHILVKVNISTPMYAYIIIKL